MLSSTSPSSGRYFLPDEVVIRNGESSAWVIVHGLVIDVTPLFQEALKKPPMAKRLQRLLAFAGSDLSSFFHPNRAPIERVDPAGERVPVFVPCMERNPATRRHWWHDPALVIGRITFRPCKVKIVNALTFRATEMVVCYEDTIGTVREKFLRYNDHAKQYEWRKDLSVGNAAGKLRMDRTLAENGFPMHRFGPVSLIWIFFILPTDTQPELIESARTLVPEKVATHSHAATHQRKTKCWTSERLI